MGVTATIIAATLVIGQSRALYAPATLDGLPGIVWVGGWRVAEDIGPDRIYRREPDGTLNLALAREGAHINDPSLIRPMSSPGVDRRGWVFMYYTGLDNEDAAAERFDRHWIGLASSTDEGRTWFDHGKIADGWAPSAVATGHEILVYYHTDKARGRVMQLAHNGWEVLKDRELVGMEGMPVPDMVNLDVRVVPLNLHALGMPFMGVMLLLANTPDLKGLVTGISLEGTRFGGIEPPVLMGVVGAKQAAAYPCLTPHLDEHLQLWCASTPDYLTGPYDLIRTGQWGEQR